MIPSRLCKGCFLKKAECRCEGGFKTEFGPSSIPFALRRGSLLAGHFVVGDMVARGGFGLIYIGYQVNLKRRVAIKEYFPARLATRESDGTVAPMEGKAPVFERYRDLFFDEGSMLGHINHKNVVSVYDIIRANNTGYLVMEYLSGFTLDQLPPQGALTVSTALGICLSLLKGLRAIHDAHLLYLDLKPQNICITKKGTIKILDLGNTRHKHYNPRDTPVAHSVGYSSPEQMHGREPVTVAADIYSFGATLYTLLTGQTPPRPEHRLTLLGQGEEDLPGLAPLSSPPPGFEHLAKVVRKCMAPSILDRYGDILELKEELEVIIHNINLHAVTAPLDEEEGRSIKEAANNLIIVAADSSGSTLPPMKMRRSRLVLTGILLLSMGAAGGALFVEELELPLGILSLLGLATFFTGGAMFSGTKKQSSKPNGWILKAHSGEYEGAYLEVDRRVLLGRDPGQCNLVFASQAISRIHASLTPNGRGGITLKDERSTSGVKVNRRRIPEQTPVDLKDGDQIQIGHQLFTVNKR